MRPRPALLLGALLAPALPLLAAAPAQAATNLCVGSPPACPAGSTRYATLPEAVTDAVSGDKIYVGPGTYSDGPYVLRPGVSLQGSGAGIGASATLLTLAAGAQTYLTVDGGLLSDLRVSLSTGTGATGIAATNGSVIDNVVVYGVGSTGSTGLRAQGATAQNVTVNVTGGAGNTAVSATGTNTFTDSTWRGGGAGLLLVSGTDTVSRVTVEDADTAVRVNAGSLVIDDAVLDLGATGTAGLLAQPTTGAAGVTAAFLTVVGGATGARGVVAAASGGLAATVTLASSIIRGPTTSLARSGGTGKTLTVTRSDYETTQGVVTDGGGNLVGVDPGFIDATTGNYDLRAGSPVIDKGVASGAAQDRAGRGRSFDGDRDGVAVPDMGAYELHDITPPTTVITSGPSGPTNDNTPAFTFHAGPFATFECQLDGSAFRKCSSPVTIRPLPDGPHTFTVRATDPAFNVEPKPPTVRFTVDTRAPDTILTKKPHKRLFRPRAKLNFTASEPGATFQCKLDNLPWRSCRSPYRWSVKVGKHRFQVRAVDAAGNRDRSPAHDEFKRLRHPKHR